VLHWYIETIKNLKKQFERILSFRHDANRRIASDENFIREAMRTDSGTIASRVPSTYYSETEEENTNHVHLIREYSANMANIFT